MLAFAIMIMPAKSSFWMTVASSFAVAFCSANEPHVVGTPLLGVQYASYKVMLITYRKSNGRSDAAH